MSESSNSLETKTKPSKPTLAIVGGGISGLSCAYDLADQFEITVYESEEKLGGHTDNMGRADLNLELSKNRVESVKNYLISKGIDQNRLVTKGHGGTKPIASNGTERTRKLNRRVNFTILKK